MENAFKDQRKHGLCYTEEEHLETVANLAKIFRQRSDINYFLETVYHKV